MAAVDCQTTNDLKKYTFFQSNENKGRATYKPPRKYEKIDS